VLRALDRAIEALIGLIAAVLLATAFAQVVARYAFGQPFTWVLELDVVLLVWLTFLSGYVGVRRRAHMAVDSLVEKMRPGWRRGAVLAGVALSFGFAALLLKTSFAVIDGMEGIPFAALPVGQSWMYWSLPVGAGLMAFALAIDFARRWRA
jgi:C4-dicarboxylate transporter DctQ subunit